MLLALQNNALLSTVEAVQTAGGGYDEKKKLYVVKKQGKTLYFTDAASALNELSRQQADKAIRRAKKSAKKALPQPQMLEVDLQAVRDYALIAGQIEQYQAAQRQQAFAQLLAMFEQMMDEEESELLMMA